VRPVNDVAEFDPRPFLLADNQADRCLAHEQPTGFSF
jgi:hypothetical protein